MTAAQVKPGDVLAGGKYRVEHLLGTGGMGVVVAARHVQLGQRVALKMMLADAASDPSSAERFAREARAAVRLQSPHTARVLDVGRLNDGAPYLVMEYLEGQDLDRVLETQGPLSPMTAVGYLVQACEALAEAHGLGMIHRDIKLKNLFLTRSVDGRALLKILDFGLVKTAGPVGEISLTTSSAIFGSPRYMSPEQLRSAKDVDARSDIWSVGVCLYELLTGRVPFDAAGIIEIGAKVLQEAVAPPSGWATDLPRELDAVVVRCLEKDPDDRFQSVAELAFALAPWTALEGSAQRVLDILQTVQSRDGLVVAPPGALAPALEYEGANTVDVLDPGERALLERARQYADSEGPPSALMSAPGGRSSPSSPSASVRGRMRSRTMAGGAFAALSLAAVATLVSLHFQKGRTFATAEAPHAERSSTAATPPSTPSLLVEPAPSPPPPPPQALAAASASAPSSTRKHGGRPMPPKLPLAAPSTAASGLPAPAARPPVSSDLADDPHG